MMSRSKIRAILAYILHMLGMIAITSQVVAAPDTTAPGPVILTDAQDHYQLGFHLQLLEDPTRKLTIEEACSPQFVAKFTPSQVEVPNFGFTRTAYWV